MKYRHQRILKTTVQIELVPEDEKDRSLLKFLSTGEPDNDTLHHYYQEGLQRYSVSALLLGLDFIEYPTMAICRFDVAIGF